MAAPRRGICTRGHRKISHITWVKLLRMEKCGGGRRETGEVGLAWGAPGSCRPIGARPTGVGRVWGEWGEFGASGASLGRIWGEFFTPMRVGVRSKQYGGSHK